MASVRGNFSTALLSLEQHRAVLDLHGVGANVLAAGGADRLAGRDMELPLMKRAFDLLALDETVGEARLPVSAGIVRGENFAGEVVDRKSTRLNSSHTVISYAVFCLKKKKEDITGR